MNRTELVREISNKVGFSQKDIKTVLEAAQEVVYGAMAKEEEVTLFEGLKLSGIRKPACVKRNPLTGQDVQVAEKVAPKAKFGAVAKRVVNGEE
jgi:nucleoid DNA-binding protein